MQPETRPFPLQALGASPLMRHQTVKHPCGPRTVRASLQAREGLESLCRATGQPFTEGPCWAKQCPGASCGRCWSKINSSKVSNQVIYGAAYYESYYGRLQPPSTWEITQDGQSFSEPDAEIPFPRRRPNI